jgi:hypothetical protein
MASSPRAFLRLLTFVIAFTIGAMFCRKGAAAGKPSELLTRNVVLITTDGLRWQEVFTGAEEALMDRTNGGVKEVKVLQDEFWRGTPNLRRQALMPFLWRVMAQQGQIWGNTNRGSTVRVANGLNFSYPGYSELLTGVVDPGIDSNDKIPNRNVTALEWLNSKPAFRGRCAAFGSWDVFPYIFNRERSGLHVRAGFEPMYEGKLNAREELMNTLIRDTTQLYEGVLYDSFLFQGVLDYVRRHKPRVLYIGFGETDDAAHDGRYDRYLLAARRVDRYLEELWNLLQGLSDYQNRTTLIFTTDHGRGSGLMDWRLHNKDIPGSEDIWLAVLGPDTPALGERSRTPLVYQKQIAATVTAFLSENFKSAISEAGEPISELMNKYPKPAAGPGEKN